MNSTPVVCITGGSGFLGKHLLPSVQHVGGATRVLTRSSGPGALSGAQIFTGDIFDAQSLSIFMKGAELLINLAQPSPGVGDARYLQGMGNLADVALKSGVKRFVHVSTAVVVGVPDADLVNESSACNPVTNYETQKLNAERILLKSQYQGMDIGILRPTAVFGLGGLNLRKQMASILSDSSMRRRLLRFVHGRRHLHLVSVADVVEAVTFLAFLQRPLAGNVFLISADDEPNNHYQAVDAILGRALGAPMPWRSPRLPDCALQILLKLAGRSQSNPKLIYDSSKLQTWGFHRVADFEGELKALGESYLMERTSL